MLCLAIFEGKAIAGSMFMFSDDYAHYHLSARDRYTPAMRQIS